MLPIEIREAIQEAGYEVLRVEDYARPHFLSESKELKYKHAINETLSPEYEQGEMI